MSLLIASQNITTIVTSLLLSTFGTVRRLKPIGTNRSKLLLGCAFLLFVFTSPTTEAQQAEIQEFVPLEAQDTIKLALKISYASNKRIRVKLDQDIYGITSKELALADDEVHVLVIRLLKGKNEITLIGYVNDVPKLLTVSCKAGIAQCNAPIRVKCDTRWCKDPYSLTPETLVVQPDEDKRASGESDTQTQQAATAANKQKEKSKGHISITQPDEDEGPTRYRDVGVVPMEIRVDQKPETKDNIKKVAITVLGDEGPVDQAESTLEPKYAKKTGEPAVLQPDVRVAKGTNTITVFDPKNPTTETASVKVICEGDNCGETDDDSPVDRFSSIYTRGIIGFEQSGASASHSVQKPFLEFFWNPPISTSESQEEPFRYIYPKASLWGTVRLTSVPQQISTPLVTFAPSFLTPINEAKVNELVQGFDFLFGAEIGFGKGLSKGDIGTAFLPTGTPNTKQKFSAYLFAGVGASSPLTPSDTVQIFKVPTNQKDIERIIGVGNTLPAGTEFIAFAGPDRDSFFRQWYAGLRLKTHYFKKASNGRLDIINRPGAMFDIGVGQNEAVTGGRLHGTVLRFDGFYPLPVSNRSILYLYGNAFINLRKHATVTDPLLLATAPSDVAVPASNVFVVTSQPSNRDLYRIGLGVNLIELFKGGFYKKPEKK